MKYLKISLVALLVVGVFSIFEVMAADKQHFAFILYEFPSKKSTYSLTGYRKLESSIQRLENYDTSKATVNQVILQSTSVTDSAFQMYQGVKCINKNVGPGDVVDITANPENKIKIACQVEGVYDLHLTKNLTLGKRVLGGNWWLDESYYASTH